MRDDGPDLVERRNIDSDLEIHLLPPLVLPALVAPEAAHDVLGDEPAFLRVCQDRAEIADHALDHVGRSPGRPEHVHEIADRGNGEVPQDIPPMSGAGALSAPDRS